MRLAVSRVTFATVLSALLLNAIRASAYRKADYSAFDVINWLQDQLHQLSKASWIACGKYNCGPMNFSTFASGNRSAVKVEPVSSINSLQKRRKKSKSRCPMIYQSSAGTTTVSYPANLCKIIGRIVPVNCSLGAKSPRKPLELRLHSYSKIPSRFALKKPWPSYRRKLLSKGLLIKHQEWSWSIGSFNQQYRRDESASFAFNDSLDDFGAVKYSCSNLFSTEPKMVDIGHVIYILSDQETQLLNKSIMADFNRKEACSSSWTLFNSDLTLTMDHYIEESAWIRNMRFPQVLEDCIFTKHTLKIKFQRDRDEYVVKVQHSCADEFGTSYNESFVKAKCWRTHRAINCKVSAVLICQVKNSSLIAEFVGLMQTDTRASDARGVVRNLINEWACEVTYFQTLCTNSPIRIETTSTDGRCSVTTQPEVTPLYVGAWYSGFTVKGIIYLSANVLISVLMWIAFLAYRAERRRTIKGVESRFKRRKNFDSLTRILEEIFRKDAASAFLTKLNSDYRGLRSLNRTLNIVSLSENSFFLVNKDARHNDLFIGMLSDGADPVDLWCFTICNNIRCTVFLPENSDSYYQMLNCLPLLLKRKRSILQSSSYVAAVGEEECNSNRYSICEIRRRSVVHRCFLFLLTNWSVEFFDRMSHRQFYMPQLVDQINCSQKTGKRRNLLLIGKRHAEIANFVALLYGGQMCKANGEMNAYKCALYAKTFITDAFTGPTAECQVLALHYGLHVTMGAVRALDCIFFEERAIPSGVADSLLIKTAQAGLRYHFQEKNSKQPNVKPKRKVTNESNTNAENRSK